MASATTISRGQMVTFISYLISAHLIRIGFLESHYTLQSLNMPVFKLVKYDDSGTFELSVGNGTRLMT
jgi:hypothetical protein